GGRSAVIQLDVLPGGVVGHRVVHDLVDHHVPLDLHGVGRAAGRRGGGGEVVSVGEPGLAGLRDRRLEVVGVHHLGARGGHEGGEVPAVRRGGVGGEVGPQLRVAERLPGMGGDGGGGDDVGLVEDQRIVGDVEVGDVDRPAGGVVELHPLLAGGQG